MIASVIGRGGRFFGEALLLMYFGNAITLLLERYSGLATLIAAGVAAASCLLYKRYLNNGH